jgi:hypothetical protein
VTSAHSNQLHIEKLRVAQLLKKFSEYFALAPGGGEEESEASASLSPPRDKRINDEGKKKVYQLPITKIVSAFCLKIALILKAA